MDRLQADVNWSKRKLSQPIIERPKSATDTHATKLLSGSASRALPTNEEITAFRGAFTPDALAELADADWKIKARAVTGLECFGEKFGWGPSRSSRRNSRR
jgi:hypothetical protein